MRVRRRWWAVGAALALGWCLLAPAGAGATEDLAEEYVALGDSFAAGPLIPPQESLDPCYRSTVDYPHVLAESLRVKTFRDVTCSGATTANVLHTPQRATTPGLPARPPQIEALTGRTTLVTVSIGANDIGLATLALSCFNALPPPAGRSCKATQTEGGVDRGARLVDSVAGRLADTLDAIRDRAPKARVLITSYANYIRPGGCYPAQPVWAQDADYMQGLVNRLGRVTAGVANQHGAEYMDFIRPGRGHDGCQLNDNWANVVVPGTTLGLVPLHPTALGERNFARILEEHLNDEL
ncbi:lysophospholipase L1-like esterase [Pseudonocardia eucalypti]|uniref:GDSL-type esterase/lipase family protein n=1 Tax=Pseudonocardia eucalypti TaxID=648755 RepID=UPI001620D039|nr:lysophospholipase L1-like esterase [Pseudonocardia eucalypti]